MDREFRLFQYLNARHVHEWCLDAFPEKDDGELNEIDPGLYAAINRGRIVKIPCMAISISVNEINSPDDIVVLCIVGYDPSTRTASAKRFKWNFSQWNKFLDYVVKYDVE